MVMCFAFEFGNLFPDALEHRPWFNISTTLSLDISQIEVNPKNFTAG